MTRISTQREKESLHMSNVKRKRERKKFSHVDAVRHDVLVDFEREKNNVTF